MSKSGFQRIAEIAQHYDSHYSTDLSAKEMSDLFEGFMAEVGEPFIDACAECGGDKGYVELLEQQIAQAGIHAMADVRHALGVTPAPAFSQRGHGTHHTSFGKVVG